MVGNGFIVKVYNLNVRQCCLLYLGQALTAILLLIPLFYVRCDNREIQGYVSKLVYIIVRNSACSKTEKIVLWVKSASEKNTLSL